MASRATIKRKQYLKTLSQGLKLYCGICNKVILYPWDLTVDHIKPKSKGGSNRVNNLQPAHYDCNQHKANNE